MLIAPDQPSNDPKVPAVLNGEKIPSVLVYLLNQLSKAVIAQFINESSVKPDTADPLGLLVVQIFSQPEFSYRGASLIDIFMAKYRFVCPVLWGVRGSEKTNEGRVRLGWRKEGDEFVNAEVHAQRMTGLGAGWAAICLRNFTNAKNPHPWPIWKYWQSMAIITQTPPAEQSETQYTVLTAMISGSEKAFINYYGAMAVMALQFSLQAFPARAIKTASSGALKVIADKLLRDTGLDLSDMSTFRGVTGVGNTK